jgi:hypothetical protein
VNILNCLDEMGLAQDEIDGFRFVDFDCGQFHWLTSTEMGASAELGYSTAIS